MPVSTFVSSDAGSGVTAVRWRGSGTGQQLYTTSKEGSLKLFNLDGSLVAAKAVDTDIRCVQVGMWNGEEVVVGGCGDASLRLWALGGSGFVERLQVSGAHEAALTAVDVDWESCMIATGSKDSFIRLWRPSAPGDER